MLDGKLKGNCKNSYFTNFEIDITEDLWDSTSLFTQLPLLGKVTINDKYDLDLRCELTDRAGFPQVLIKTRNGWFTMDNLIVKRSSINFNIDHDPEVPVTVIDLMIIRKAKEFLSDKTRWHKKDDRNCEDDIIKNCYSLFCALKTASIEMEGEYNHRNAIMQKIRHTIVEIFPEKDWQHRLRDFNNMPETDFAVLMDLLNRVENEVKTELNNKSN